MHARTRTYARKHPCTQLSCVSISGFRPGRQLLLPVLPNKPVDQRKQITNQLLPAWLPGVLHTALLASHPETALEVQLLSLQSLQAIWLSYVGCFPSDALACGLEKDRELKGDQQRCAYSRQALYTVKIDALVEMKQVCQSTHFGLFVGLLNKLARPH